MFGEVGYRAAALREIAARAGITHPGLLYHFGSKQELLAAVLDSYDDGHDELLDWDQATPEEVVDAFYGLAEQKAEDPKRSEVFTALSAEAINRDHPAHDHFVARYEDVREHFTRLTKILADAGMLRPGVTPEGAATNLIALLDGLQIQWLYDPDAVDLSAQIDCYFRGILKSAPQEALRAAQRLAS